MAKQRLIELPQMRARYQIAGDVTGTEKNNFIKDKKTKNGADMKLLNFGVKVNKDEDTVYVGMIGMTRDNVYFSRPANKEKGIARETKVIPWKDRLTFAAPDGFRMIGVSVGMDRKTDSEGIERAAKVTMTEYDACNKLASDLYDNMPVFVSGEIEFSSWNGSHRKRFNINNITRTKEIDMNDENFKQNAKFTCPIIFMGIEKDDAVEGRYVISAKFVNYESIEDIELFTYNDVLAKTMRKALKPYTYIECWGNIEVIKNIVEEENNDIWGETNDMARSTVTAPVQRELIVTGADSSSIDKETYSESAVEEAIARIAAGKQAAADYAGNAAGSWGTGNEPDISVDADEDNPW